jgi:poly-gamma-glutamate synthesis protein (capsule biosynthesis protein)
VAAIADEPRPDEMTLVFVGDIMLDNAMHAVVAERGHDHPFAGTAPLLRQADLAVGNLEGSVADRAETTKGRWSQRMSSASLQGLVRAGIDAVSLANNHVHDCGDAGVRETIAHLDRAGIASFGAGASARQARAPRIVEARGLRVALLGGVSTSMLLDPDWLDDPAMIARRRRTILTELTHAGNAIEMGSHLHTPETLAEDVAAARKEADLVVVSLHMGVIHHRPPYVDQVQLAEAAAGAGADLVVGHHAHLWQPVALVGRTPVIYGVGNHAFGFDDRKADEGLIVRAVVSTRTRRITRVELFPLATDNADERIRYEPQLLGGESARVALEDLRAWSAKLCGTALEVRDGRAVLRLSG